MKGKNAGQYNSSNKGTKLGNSEKKYTSTEITMGDKKFKIENSNEVSALRKKVSVLENENINLKNKVNTILTELQKVKNEMRIIRQEQLSTKFKGNNSNDTGFYQ